MPAYDLEILETVNRIMPTGGVKSAIPRQSTTTRDAIVEVMKQHFEFDTEAIRQTISACAIDAETKSLNRNTIYGEITRLR